MLINSEIDFINESTINEKWTVTPLKYLARIQTGNTPKIKNNDLFVESDGIEWIKTDNLNFNNPLKNAKQQINKKYISEVRIAQQGNILISCIGDIGKIGYADKKVTYNQQINAVVFNNQIYWKYGLYFLMCQKEQHEYFSHGNVLKILNTENQKKLKIKHPKNINLQKSISDKLDIKIKKIDFIVNDTKQSIEELEKYKQSLITEVVTKGLDENVEMKDSGVEWIGEIPRDINVIRIKNLFLLKGRIGWQGLNSKEYRDEGAYLITGTDFSNGEINWDKCVRISQERYSEAPEIQIKENDLLITKDGTIGKVAITKNTPQEVSLNSGVLLMRKKKTKYNLQLKMMYYILLSDIFWEWFNMNDVGGSTIKHLYQNQFYNFSFPLFDEAQQIKIISFLDNKIKVIDSLINDKQEIISEYETYKKSLIYEYVTGKKEV